MMRFSLRMFATILWLLFAGSGLMRAETGREPVHIVRSATASTPQRLAVEEMIARLRRIYPDETFVIAATLPSSGRAIVVAEPATGSALLGGSVLAVLTAPESFVIQGRANGATIAGADARGVVHGVYAFLEKLGCGFFLSDESEPAPRHGRMEFESWSLSDAPLFGDRIGLNWHNFLSSASTWEFADWERYIDALARMRFNDLMVHAYGNSPMFTFTFNGVTKPVGYLATTQRGRDWGTQHVNDVRRLVGGEVFDGPVFGASIAQGDPAHRVDAAVTLMRRVFAHARARGLGATFALDVDTASANPPEIIATLPPEARFRSGNHELANPDTPAGFAYYRAQVEQLLALYPDLTRIAVWFRDPTARTPWRLLKRAEMPAAWQREFTGPDEDVSAFALAKVVHAFRRALAELKRDDVALVAGSWAFPFLAATDRYLAPEIPVIALDWWVSFDTARAQRDLRAVRSGRPVIPILWAHHDDRTYVGRPYTPFVDIATKLERARAAGFGVIHWTTRPLDLYFRSTSRQTWRDTRDEPLELTCADLAARAFGEPAREAGGRYLFSWVTEAPMFGRETSAHFIDHPLPTPAVHAQLGRERLALLEAMPREGLTSDGRERLDYFAAYERFMLSFFAAHTAVERAHSALQHGDFPRARAEVRDVDPARVIGDYVTAAKIGAITPGEKALIVSLNLRWRPDVLSVRQAVGLEPVRYRWGEVQQEPLAQGAEPNTYFVDEQQRFWKVLDRATSGETLRLAAFGGDRLEPGRYTVNGRATEVGSEGVAGVSRAQIGDELVIEKAPERVTARAIPFESDLSGWRVEQVPGGSVRVVDGALVIEDRVGCSVWWKEKLTAPVEISYDVTVVDRGGPLDRVSDVNCFWMASDPAKPDAVPSGRSGRFSDYDKLRTYYVGMGGNDNTSTRFRRYLGNGERPLRPEHDLRDAKFLLQPNRTYHIRLVARDGVAEFWRDGERVFSFVDPEPLTAGWFAFRAMHCHLEIRNLRITR